MTAKIKLNAASGGGSVSLKAPSTTTSNAAVELQLPVADGSANQVIKTDGSGNLSFVAQSGGLFSSYALLANVHTASSANLGTFTSGDWRTRDINTELADPDSIVTLSSNQFTLQAGSYLIEYTCVAYGVNRHAVRLRNITDSSSAGQADASYLNAGMKDMFPISGAARVVISGAKVFEIQGQAEPTTSDNGFGFTMLTGPSETVRVKIFKEA